MWELRFVGKLCRKWEWYIVYCNVKKIIFFVIVRVFCLGYIFCKINRNMGIGKKV